MRRQYTRTGTIQASNLVDNGLESVVSWDNGNSYPVRILPASAAEAQRAGLRGEFATHVAIVPRGLNLSTLSNRLKVGSQIYRIIGVRDMVTTTMLTLEERTGDDQ